MSQGFVPLSCPPLQDCHFGKTGNDSAFQLPAQTTLQLLILISWPNRRYSRCWRLREGLTVVLWDVNLNPLPHKNCPIIQQADCVLSLLIPPQFSSSHLQYIVRPLKIAVFFPPSFLFLPQVCIWRHVQWEQKYCSCNLMSLQPPPTLCLCRPLFWKH